MPLNSVNWMRLGAVAAGIIIGWPSTNASIPLGWARETTLDAKFPKMIATSGTNPGGTGGATTHDHPFAVHSAHVYSGHNHSGSWGNSGGSTDGGSVLVPAGGASFPTQGHVHTSSSVAAADIAVTGNSSQNTDTQVSDPLHVTQVFIRSTGAAIGIPSTGLVWYNGAAPSGWATYSTIDNRLMKGAAAAGDGGSQAGTDGSAHTHTSAGHTHPVGGTHTHVVALDNFNNDTSVNSPQFSGDTNTSPHSHTLGTSGTGSNPANSDSASETTGTGDGTPQWYKLRAIQPSGGGVTKTQGIIAMWLGLLAAIPGGWILCDGTGGTPNLCNGKFVMAAATDGAVGNTGGATTHTHAAGTAHSHTSSGNHSHTFTGASSTIASGSRVSPGSFAFMFDSGHSHSSTTYTSSSITIGTSTTQATTQSANTTNNPANVDVAYLQKTAN